MSDRDGSRDVEVVERLTWLRDKSRELRGLCVDRQGRAVPFRIGPPSADVAAKLSTRRGHVVPATVPKGGSGRSSLSPNLAVWYLGRGDAARIFSSGAVRFPVGDVVDVVLADGSVLAGRLVVAERVVLGDDGRPAGRKVELRTPAGVDEHVDADLVVDVRPSDGGQGPAGALVRV